MLCRAGLRSLPSLGRDLSVKEWDMPAGQSERALAARPLQPGGRGQSGSSVLAPPGPRGPQALAPRPPAQAFSPALLSPLPFFPFRFRSRFLQPQIGLWPGSPLAADALLCGCCRAARARSPGLLREGRLRAPRHPVLAPSLLCWPWGGPGPQALRLPLKQSEQMAQDSGRLLMASLWGLVPTQQCPHRRHGLPFWGGGIFKERFSS